MENKPKNTSENIFKSSTKDTKNTAKKQPQSLIFTDALEQNIQNLEQDLNDQNTSYGLFKIQEANKWIEDANKRPIPKMLFDSFWHEGELCILFADTNLGKSILAVQIGDSLSTGVAIQGFKLEAQQQKVLYFDFELSDKQFENRYSINYQKHYQFSSNFERAEINPNIDLPSNFDNFEDYLSHSLELYYPNRGNHFDNR